MEIYKAYKFRLYPTDDQKVLINKTFGCKRLIIILIILKKTKVNLDMIYIKIYPN